MNTIDKSNLLAELHCITADAGNQANAAKQLGISQSYLCDVLSGRREPGKKLLLALKFKRVITYEPERLYDAQGDKDEIHDHLLDER